jgi:hypothetical protein
MFGDKKNDEQKSPNILEQVMASVTFEASDQREVFWYNEQGRARS